MKRLALIALDFHRRTRSVDFLRELLEQRYEVSLFFIDSGLADPFAGLDGVCESGYEALVCWQVLPPRDALDRHFKFHRGAFFPMFDGCPSVFKTERWYPYRDFQIICFCEASRAQVTRIGLAPKFIRYFPELPPEPAAGEPDAAFLWFRREAISPSLVRAVLGSPPLRRLHLHDAPDPGNKLPPIEDLDGVAVTISRWSEDRSAMVEAMKRCAFFFAPRPAEGIGMAFLEAMAMGKCVVAPDRPTMNEYIEHGRTGLLYDPARPARLSGFDLSGIQRRTRDFAVSAHDRWKLESALIFDWIEEAPAYSRVKLGGFLLLRFVRNPVKVFAALMAGRRGDRDPK